jgi:hypothetical protein
MLPLGRLRAKNAVQTELTKVQVEVKLRPTVGRPVCLGVGLPSGAHDQTFCFLSGNCWFLDVGHPLWREDGSVIYSYNFFWVLPEQSLSGPIPQNSRPYFIISFETPPNLEGQIPVFISPRKWVAQLYPRALGSLSVASYDSQGLRCRFSNPPPHGSLNQLKVKSQNHVTTDGRSVGRSVSQSVSQYVLMSSPFRFS